MVRVDHTGIVEENRDSRGLTGIGGEGTQVGHLRQFLVQDIGSKTGVEEAPEPGVVVDVSIV